MASDARKATIDNSGTRRATRNVVAIAASTGGLDALTRVLSGLPAGFGAPVLVVQHLEPDRTSRLREILNDRTSLEVRWASDGARAGTATVNVAPPDLHLRLESDGTISLTKEEQVNFARPSADILFRSAADAFGEGVIAVVLTGKGRDGSGGAAAVRRSGGTVIAQDESTSVAYDMPRSVIESVGADLVLPIGEVAPALVRAIGRGA
jgi:two-component system chemotaxis response regulator CheB